MISVAELSVELPEVPAIQRPSRSKVKATGRIEGRFLRGPIPWSWLTKAAQLPGGALQLAMAIWYLDGFDRTGTVKLKPSVVRELGMDRHASYRALKGLESAALVSAVRKRGSSPLVTLLV